jgi:phenylglyoxylate dehydrogenase epsilon subunit
MAKKHVIIGCGSAALAALEKIRGINSDDEISVVSMEPYLPYSPTSLPYLLAGKVKESDIWIKDEDYFHGQNATLLRGKEVVQLPPDRKQVVYGDGNSDDYDTLLIASGSEPAKPPIPGIDEVGFLGFHTLEDYHRLLPLLEGRRNVTILGAGLIGMEIAAALAERGHQVRVIEMESRVLPLYFDEEPSAYIKSAFAGKGVEIFTGKQVAELNTANGKANIICTNGDTFATDLLLTCTGVRPRTAFTQGSGIETNQGVVVDRRMQTNKEGVYAAGDVAEAVDFFSGQYGISGIIPSAVEQGKVAGANMAGEEAAYQGWVSMNVFNFLGHTASSIGLSMVGREDKEVLERQDDGHFQRLVFQDGHLIGAMFLNIEVNPGVVRYLIENKIGVANHKQLLSQKVRETSLWLMLEAERKQAGLVEG